MKLLSEAARNMGFALAPGQLKKFEFYYRELTVWNQRFNLTAVTDYEHVQIRHFLDSLSCLLAVGSCQGGR